MNDKSVLIDHPLIRSYLKTKKIKSFNENTEFPIGLLAAVYQDYTGQKVIFTKECKLKSDQLISFSDFFSPEMTFE